MIALVAQITVKRKSSYHHHYDLEWMIVILTKASIIIHRCHMCEMCFEVTICMYVICRNLIPGWLTMIEKCERKSVGYF